MSPSADYFQHCRELLVTIERQQAAIEQAADWFAAMILENVSGLAERILRNFDLSTQDSALVASSSGCNVVPVEIAEGFRQRGVRVVAILSRRHSDATPSQRADGR